MVLHFEFDFALFARHLFIQRHDFVNDWLTIYGLVCYIDDVSLLKRVFDVKMSAPIEY